MPSGTDMLDLRSAGRVGVGRLTPSSWATSHDEVLGRVPTVHGAADVACRGQVPDAQGARSGSESTTLLAVRVVLPSPPSVGPARSMIWAVTGLNQTDSVPAVSS